MRLPLELLRMVIRAAVCTFELKEFIVLRLVNRSFDEEALSYAFGDSQRLIDEHTFQHAPSSLREKYLLHLIKRHPQEPSVFAYLFIPVFERELQKLAIQDSDHEIKDALLKEWLQIPMHDDFFVCAVAHEHRHFEIYLNQWMRYTIPGAKYIESPEFDQGLKVQIVHEWTLGQLCYAIIKDDEQILFDVLEAYQRKFDDKTSYCFGTTLLRFAVQRGSISVLRTVLRYTRPMQENHLFSCFKAAVRRDEAHEECVWVLLDHYANLDLPYRTDGFISFIFSTALRQGHPEITKHILSWLDTDSEGAKVQRTIDNIFSVAIRAGAEQIVHRVGPKVHMSGPHGYTFLQGAMNAPGQRIDILQYLLDNGADPNAGTTNTRMGQYPLWMAAQSGNIACFELLLQKGADPRSQEGGLSILTVARWVGKEPQISQLLKENGWESMVPESQAE